MREQDIIARYFAPLSADAAADGVLLGAGDDAAALQPPPGTLLLSTDTLNAGVHFFADDAPESLARKAAAVSLSDIAAMGGRPLWLTLALTAPAQTGAAWFERFAAGLAQSSRTHGYRLVGGDLTNGAHLSITTTAAGICAQPPVTRRGARPGDAIWISGWLGAASYALAVRRGEMPAGQGLPAAQRALQDPQPRLQVAAALAGTATAMMDISDGLLVSAVTLAAQSGVQLRLQAEAALSAAHPALAVLDSAAQQQCAFSGGDEYELLFTAPAAARIPAQIDGIPLTRIGQVHTGSGAEVRTVTGEILPFTHFGYSHDFAR